MSVLLAESRKLFNTLMKGPFILLFYIVSLKRVQTSTLHSKKSIFPMCSVATIGVVGNMFIILKWLETFREFYGN